MAFLTHQVSGRSTWRNEFISGCHRPRDSIAADSRDHDFIRSLPPGVNPFACVVRMHCGIESSCRWNLDFTVREDKQPIRDKRVRMNLTRRFASPLLTGVLSLLATQVSQPWFVDSVRSSVDGLGLSASSFKLHVTFCVLRRIMRSTANRVDGLSGSC